MKLGEITAILLFGNLFPIVCAVTAGYMATHGILGWGWFLFVGVITVSMPKGSKDD